MERTSIWAVGICAALGALTPACSCGGTGDDGDGADASSTSGAGGAGGATYESVTVEPPKVSLTVDLGKTATQDYKAFGTAMGEKTDVSTSCSWAVDSAFGAMSGPTLTAQPHGGETQVAATCGGVTGTSDLTVDLEGTVLATPDTPANAPALFQGAQPGADPARTPTIEYPLDGAIAPLNIPSIEAQWTLAQNDLFHVSFLSTHVAVDLYTTAPQGTLTAKDWLAVVESAAGETLTVVVEGLVQADPATKFVSAPVKVVISHDVIDKTAIYYWASSQGNIMTQVFGNTDAPTAVKDDCTSCHSVSRSGSRIGYSRCVGGSCGDIHVGFLRYDVASSKWLDTVDANAKAIAGSYTSFAPVGNPFPDDSKAVALVTTTAAVLELYDPDTGQVVPSNVADVSTHGPGAPRSALMPDWSPQGGSVVFASTPNAGQWIDLSGGAIATMSYSFAGGMHTFGEPVFLVASPITLPSGVYDNFFFPSWSSDGQLLVFDAARGAWRNSGDAAAPGQRLLLANATASWTVELAAMNGPGDLNVTWPHWAPGETKEHYWVVFSSERDYGHEVTKANANPACLLNGVKQCKQLWIGAVDRKKVGGANGPGGDPSAPPMWMPGQDITADNISPYWSVPPSRIPQ